jgi:O-antigen/teichoic acid export membrane protein
VAGALLYTWTGREVAIEAQALLVMLAVAGMLGCASNVFAYYLLANGRSRATALITLITALVTLASSAVALTHFGWRAAGWGVLLGMITQIAVTTLLLRRSFELPQLWSRLFHLVLQPLGTGIATAIGLRYFFADRLFDHAPRWWFVGVSYGAAAGIVFVVVVTVSCMGPYGETCWRDLRLIASRFLLRASV